MALPVLLQSLVSLGELAEEQFAVRAEIPQVSRGLVGHCEPTVSLSDCSRQPNAASHVVASTMTTADDRATSSEGNSNWPTTGVRQTKWCAGAGSAGPGTTSASVPSSWSRLSLQHPHLHQQPGEV